jgi:hypothetical protein
VKPFIRWITAAMLVLSLTACGDSPNSPNSGGGDTQETGVGYN